MRSLRDICACSNSNKERERERENVSKLRGGSADNVARARNYATVRTAARQFRTRRLLINCTLHSSFVHIQRYIRRYPNCLRIDLRMIQILIMI